jgi:hypothetical protein
MELLPILFVIGLFTMLNLKEGGKDKDKKEDQDADIGKLTDALKDYLKKGVKTRK